uniref:Uncharacterized protein n=1 Tax=Anguilla anguilla TaxID=7936 RepID=A0A0E9T9J4_ANGAN
MLWLADRTVL